MIRKVKKETDAYEWECEVCHKTIETSHKPNTRKCNDCCTKEHDANNRRVESAFVGAVVTGIVLDVDKYQCNVLKIDLETIDGKEFIVYKESNWDEPDDIVIKSKEEYEIDGRYY